MAFYITFWGTRGSIPTPGYRTRVFGLPAAVMLFGCMAYSLVKWDAEIVKLPPALQSPWFVPHVMVYFVGYAAVSLAFALAAIQLLAPRVAFVQRLRGEDVERQALQRIAHEQGGRFVEFHVHRGLAAPQCVVVHRRHVVVDERVGVDALDGTRQRQRILHAPAAGDRRRPGAEDAPRGDGRCLQ